MHFVTCCVVKINILSQFWYLFSSNVLLQDSWSHRYFKKEKAYSAQLLGISITALVRAKAYQILYQGQVFCIYLKKYQYVQSQALCSRTSWSSMQFQNFLLSLILHSNFHVTLGKNRTIQRRNIHKQSIYKQACKLSLIS